MTTYTVTAPDGSKYDVTGDGTAEEALKHFQDNYTVRRDENYGHEGRSHPLVNPDADKGTMARFAAGVSGNLDTIRTQGNDFLKRILPDDPGGRTLITGSKVAPTATDPEFEASMQRSRNRSEQYEATKDQLGTAGMVGDYTPEVLATLVPLARASTAVARVPLLAKTLGRLAPAAADIGVNAAYAGGKAAVQGKSGDEVLDDALLGGGGAAVGRVLFRALAGSKSLVSQSARKLVDQGVLPTPGQLFDGPVGNFLRSAEDKAMSVPGVGEIVGYSRRRAAGEFGRASTNEAISGLPGAPRVSGFGQEAVEAAQSKISSVYDDALDGMQLHPALIDLVGDVTKRQLKQIPLIDKAQRQKVADYIALRIAPQVQNGVMDGQAAKALDAEMGHYARQFSRSINPADKPLGEAFYTLQTTWREAMASGSTPDKTALLVAANEAHKNLLPLVKAADKAAAQGGVFTPNQLQRAHGSFHQTPSALTQAGQEVLPGRVPDSGTAGRLLLAGAIGGGAAITGPVAGATLVASLLYTRPGINLFLNGVGGLLPQASKDYLRRLPPKAFVAELQRMHAKYPYLREGMERTLNQMSAQAGRMSETQPPQSYETTEGP